MAGDIRRLFGLFDFQCFNPRPRMAGDTKMMTKKKSLLRFQSTPAYGGRHTPVDKIVVVNNVSIHARVWRATLSYAFL